MKTKPTPDSSDRDKLLAAYDVAQWSNADPTQVIIPGAKGGPPVLVAVIARGEWAARLAKWLARQGRKG